MLVETWVAGFRFPGLARNPPESDPRPIPSKSRILNQRTNVESACFQWVRPMERKQLLRVCFNHNGDHTAWVLLLARTCGS